jgi:hypothetical protein
MQQKTDKLTDNGTAAEFEWPVCVCVCVCAHSCVGGASPKQEAMVYSTFEKEMLTFPRLLMFYTN